ncbi:MAG: hypothetical protein J6X47_00530, partial [Clostridia bacterium]|nr:hypothetical protein [Clostridia bacterium]
METTICGSLRNSLEKRKNKVPPAIAERIALCVRTSRSIFIQLRIRTRKNNLQLVVSTEKPIFGSSRNSTGKLENNVYDDNQSSNCFS